MASCYRRCLELAEQYNIRTIAFPAISTGVYRFPIERATKIAVTEISQFLQKNTSIEQVIFLYFCQQAYDCYSSVMKELGIGN